MSYEAEQLAIRLWLDKITSWWKSFRARLPTIPRKWVVLLLIGGLVAYALLLRCLHLLHPGNYFVVSADSYFFDWLARGIMDGMPHPTFPGAADPYALHSGLAYPLAYIAKAVNSVFGLSNGDALALVSKFLPPVLGVISIVLIYLVAARISNRRVGLFSALAWAGTLNAVFIGAAGYLDRDGLSMLLVMTGAFLFYFCRGWQFRIGGRDVGWLLAALGVLGIEVILYLEWVALGPILLLVIIGIYFIVRYLLEYLYLLKTEPSMIRRLANATRAVNWRTFALIMGVNIVYAVGLYSQGVKWYNFATGFFFRPGEQNPVAELQGLGVINLLNYHFFLIPIAVGIYVALKRRDEGGIFFSSWFIFLVACSLFSARLLLYALPAACLIAGLGLNALWGWGKWTLIKPLLKKLAVVVLFILMILIPLYSYELASAPGTAVDEDWHDAMIYLRDKTPEDAKIMTWWGYGYWILDMGERIPVVDNGYYGWDKQRLTDIRTAYLSTDITEAVQVMEKYGADYFIFSKIDEYSAPGIISYPNTPKQIDGKWEEFPEDSLVSRSLAGDFQSEGGLEVVHRNPGVVILSLTQR